MLGVGVSRLGSLRTANMQHEGFCWFHVFDYHLPSPLCVTLSKCHQQSLMVVKTLLAVLRAGLWIGVQLLMNDDPCQKAEDRLCKKTRTGFGQASAITKWKSNSWMRCARSLPSNLWREQWAADFSSYCRSSSSGCSATLAASSGSTSLRTA